MDKKLTRNTNFEILRIISMIMIVAHHFAVHSGFDFSKMSYINSLWIAFLCNGGKIGVNLFVFISGYFLVSNKKYKSSNILKLYLKAVIYGFILFMLAKLCFGLEGMPLELVITPFSNSSWWFLTFYFILYITYPFINKFIYIY